MNRNDQPGPMDNLIEGLSQHAQFLTREERKAELRARGVDVDAFLAEAHSIIDEHKKEERLAWMKIADKKRERIEASEQTFQSWIGKSEEAIRAGFAKFLENLTEPAIAFRNKTDLTIEDMARILDDYERLRLRTKSRKPETQQ